MKVKRLKFKKEMSLSVIKSYMNYYRGIGQVVMTVINGVEIYSNDPNFDNVFERLELGLTEGEYKEYKKLMEDNHVYEQRIENSDKIEKDIYFRFYYGLVKTMIKPNKIGEFEDLVNSLGMNFVNELMVIAQIILALENDNKIDMYREISNIINSIKNMDVHFDVYFDNIYNIVKDMAIKGDMLDLVFFKNTTLDYRNGLIRKLSINNNRINEIKKR